jgi:hypothetical protein
MFPGARLARPGVHAVFRLAAKPRQARSRVKNIAHWRKPWVQGRPSPNGAKDVSVGVPCLVPFFRPFGLLHFGCLLPRACAVGYIVCAASRL